MRCRSVVLACSMPDIPPKPGVAEPFVRVEAVETVEEEGAGGSISSWASCRTPFPRMPVRSRIASSSASERASGPRDSSFSRGRASVGRAWMDIVMVAFRKSAYRGMPDFLQWGLFIEATHVKFYFRYR